jgi:XTP/dITP diphosphohydrolase
MKLIFASNNKHKVEELKNFVGNQFEILSLKDAEIDIDIPEPFDTLEENATIKSRTIFELTGMNCFSEDTGLIAFECHAPRDVFDVRVESPVLVDDEHAGKLARRAGWTGEISAHLAVAFG